LRIPADAMLMTAQFSMLLEMVYLYMNAAT
jgi:hypothetical protein